MDEVATCGTPRRWRWLSGSLLALLLMITALPAFAAEDAEGILGQNLELDGGVIDFDKEKNAVIIRNYATVTMGPLTIRSRNLVYYSASKEVYAEGHVSFDEPGGSSFYCDRLFFNTITRRALAENIRIKAQRAPEAPVAEPTLLDEIPKGPRHRGKRSSNAGLEAVNRLLLSADEVRSISHTHQELIGAKITTSAFAKPHWWIESKAVNYRRNEKVESWHNFLKIGGVPVLYFPYFIKDLKYDWPWVRVGGGHTDEWGTFLLTKWGFDLDTNKDAIFRPTALFYDADYRQNRGFGTGFEMEYNAGRSDSYGFLDLYYTRETMITKEEDWDRGWNKNEVDFDSYGGYPTWRPATYRKDDRWAIDWWHRQRFTERWDLRMEVHAYSDRDFRKEYFEDQYKQDKEPETSFDLRYLHENVEVELVAQKRLNDWQNQSEYLPELRVTVPGLRLGSLPLYLQANSAIGYVNRKYDTELDEYNLIENDINRVKSGDDYEPFFRAHADAKILAPIHLGKVATLTPYVGGRVTYYEEQYGHPGGIVHSSDEDTNSAFLWGAALSSRFYGHFKNNTWRHVVEPTISFTANEKPNIDPTRLYYIDEIDTYEEAHFFTFALHQKLQTRRNGRTIDVLDFDVKVSYLPDEEEQDRSNYGREWSDLEFDIVWRPTDSLVFFTYGRFDMEDSEFNRLTGGMDWRFRDKFRLYVGHEWLRGEYYAEPTALDSSETTIAFRTKLWNNDSKYSMEYALTYQWEDNRDVEHGVSEQRITLYRDLDTFELGISYVRDEKDDDQGVYFTLSPKGWGEAGLNASATVSASAEGDSRYGHPSIGAELDDRSASWSESATSVE